jgi:tetratricopeptide (TPR) repeat protein
MRTLTRLPAVAATAFLLSALLLPPVTGATEEGDGDARAQALEQRIARHPSDAAARLELADLYQAQGQLDRAIEQYEAAVRLTDPATPQGRDARLRLRYFIATRHAQRGEFDAALPIFQELAAEYPDNPTVLYSLGVAHLIKQQVAQARAAFERVIAVDPGYASAYLNLATIEQLAGEKSKAVTHLQKVIELSPGSPTAAQAQTKLDLIEGQLLADQGDLADAIASFRHVLEREPKNAEALATLADLYRRSHNEDAEFATLQDAVAAHPDNHRLRLRLAELYASFGRYREAYQQLEPILDQGPASPLAAQAQEIYGRIRSTDVVRRIEREKSAAKITTLQARVRDDPDDIASWLELGRLQYGRGDFADAVQAFSEVKRLDPQNLPSRYGLAAIYDSMGRFEDSVDEYAALISMEPNERVVERLMPALLLAKAKKLYVEGKFRDAIRAFEELLAKNPDNEAAHFYLGLIYSREDEMARAVDAYREVIRLVPGHIGARLNLASTYERLNREEDAIDEYAKILQAHPPPEVENAARRGLVNAQRRLRGFSMNLGYLMGYDSNSNLSGSDPQTDLRSDLSFNLAYQYKMENDLRWRFLFAPVYSTYHNEGFDFLNTTTTVSAAAMPGSYTLVGGFTNRVSDGLVTNRRLGRMNMVFGDAFTRVRLPALFNSMGEEKVSTNLSFSASYSDFDSKSSPFFSAYTTTLGASVSQPASERRVWRASYQFVLNSNKEAIGNDYAYRSHEVSLGLDYLMPWGALNANAGAGTYYYTNRDSFSQFTRHRRNLRYNAAVGASWRWKRDLSFFTTLSWTENDSNLPVGFVLSSADIIEALQSSSLSDYSRVTLITGMNLNF